MGCDVGEEAQVKFDWDKVITEKDAVFDNWSHALSVMLDHRSDLSPDQYQHVINLCRQKLGEYEKQLDKQQALIRGLATQWFMWMGIALLFIGLLITKLWHLW